MNVVADDPNRVAPQDYGPARLTFDELSPRTQLDIAERATRTRYRGALHEAFSIDNEEAFRKFLVVLLDSSCADSDVGATAREFALQYISRCAAAQEDDLAELGG